MKINIYYRDSNLFFKRVLKFILMLIFGFLSLWFFSIWLFASSCDTSNWLDPDWDYVLNENELSVNTNPCIHNSKLESIDSVLSVWWTWDFIEYVLPDNFLNDWLDSYVDLDKSWFITFETYWQWDAFWENYSYTWAWLSGSLVYSWSMTKTWSDFFPFSWSIANFTLSWSVSMDIAWNDNRYYWIKLVHTNMPEMDRLIYIWKMHSDIVPPVCSVLLSWSNHEQTFNWWQEHQWDVYLAQKTISGAYNGAWEIIVYSTWWDMFDSFVSWENISIQCEWSVDLTFTWRFMTKFDNLWSITLNWDWYSWAWEFIFDDNSLTILTWSRIYTWWSVSVIWSWNSMSLSWELVWFWNIYFYWDWELSVNNCPSYSLSLSWSLSLPPGIWIYTINWEIWENSLYKWVASLPNFTAAWDDLIWWSEVSTYESWSIIPSLDFVSNFYLNWWIIDNGILNIIEASNVNNFDFSCINDESSSVYMNFSADIIPDNSIKRISLSKSITENANIKITGSWSLEVFWLNWSPWPQIYSWSSLLITWSGSFIEIIWAWKVDNLSVSWSWWVLELVQDNWNVNIRDCSQIITVNWSGSILTWSIAWTVEKWEVDIFTWSFLVYPWLYARERIWDISPWNINPVSYKIKLADNLSWFNNTWNILSFFTWSDALNVVWSIQLTNLDWKTFDSGNCSFKQYGPWDADDVYECSIGDFTWESEFPDKNDLALKIDLKDKAWNTFSCKSLSSKVDNKSPFVWSKISEGDVESWMDILAWIPVVMMVKLDSSRYWDWSKLWAKTSSTIWNSLFRKSDFKINNVLFTPYSWSAWSWWQVKQWFYYEKWIEFLENEWIWLSSAVDQPVNFKLDNQISLMSGAEVLTWVNLVDWDSFIIKYSFKDFAWNWKWDQEVLTINSRFYAKVLWNVNSKTVDLRGDDNVQVFEIEKTYQDLLEEFKTNLRSIDPDKTSETTINSVSDFWNQLDDEIIYKVEGDIILSWSFVSIAWVVWNKKVLDLRDAWKPVTIWAVNWNIYIDSDYLLSSSWNLALISTKYWNWSYNKWNIFIRDNVQFIQATLIADWSILSYAVVEYWWDLKKKVLFNWSDRKILFRNQLVIEGSLVSKNTIWWYSVWVCPNLIYWTQWENNTCDETDVDLQFNLMKMYDLHYLREYYYLGPSSYSFSPSSNLTVGSGHLVSSLDNVDTVGTAYSWTVILNVYETINELASITDLGFRYMTEIWKRFQRYSFEYYPVVIKPLKPSLDMTFFKWVGNIKIEPGR